MSRKKKRKSFLQRAEETILEHVPGKYQKSIVGVYRLGFFMNIIGIIGIIFLLFSIFSIFYVKDSFTIDGLITRIVLLAIAFGLAVLGGRYTKMKMNPPLAFGWALFVGIVCLILTGFFGFILVASLMSTLSVVYGQVTILVIEAIMLGLMILPLAILVNIIYYLFFAHKGYTEWYADYAKRHRLCDEAVIVKKKTKAKSKKESEDYCDEDL